MKLKLDFVSNSSSTSFVYISEAELNKEAFFEAAGVEADSPVADLFSEMFDEIQNGIKHGDSLATREDVDNAAEKIRLMPYVVEKMKAAVDEGKIVVAASLSSDGPLAESALCMEIFEIESDAFFINAYDNYW